MRYRTVLSLFLVAALAACAEPAPEAESEAGSSVDARSDVAAIDALAEEWEAAYNAHDADAVAALYAEEAWVYPADGGGFEGREAVHGWLATAMESSPTAEITPVETRVFEDRAVSMGTYSITASPPEGGPLAFSGAYMNALERMDGEWKIVGTMSNYDATPPEGWAWNPPMEGDPPAEDDTLEQVVESYEAAWNAGDAEGVAALYAEDALVAYSDGPVLEGRAAVEAAASERTSAGGTLDVHQVGAQELGDGWMATGGWWELTGPDGEAMQTGSWMNLNEVQDDGSSLVHWTLTNGRPAGT